MNEAYSKNVQPIPNRNKGLCLILNVAGIKYRKTSSKHSFRSQKYQFSLLNFNKPLLSYSIDVASKTIYRGNVKQHNIEICLINVRLLFKKIISINVSIN
jgi:hypothetical protein